MHNLHPMDIQELLEELQRDIADLFVLNEKMTKKDAPIKYQLERARQKSKSLVLAYDSLSEMLGHGHADEKLEQELALHRANLQEVHMPLPEEQHEPIIDNDSVQVEVEELEELAIAQPQEDSIQPQESGEVENIILAEENPEELFVIELEPELLNEAEPELAEELEQTSTEEEELLPFFIKEEAKEEKQQGIEKNAEKEASSVRNIEQILSFSFQEADTELLADSTKDSSTDAEREEEPQKTVVEEVQVQEEPKKPILEEIQVKEESQAPILEEVPVQNEPQEPIEEEVQVQEEPKAELLNDLQSNIEQESTSEAPIAENKETVLTNKTNFENLKLAEVLDAPITKDMKLEYELDNYQEIIKSIAGLMNVSQKEVKDIGKPIKRLIEAIGLNERFEFITDLFDNKTDVFYHTVQTIDQMTNYNDALQLLERKFDWKDSEIKTKFMNLVQRRFL